MLLPWLVVSPEYGDVIPILDDGTGPTEYGCDVCFVEAETKRDALVLGVRQFRRMGAKYIDRLGGNPYTGVQVHSQVCDAHGHSVWAGDHFECPDCEALIQCEPSNT